MKQLAFTLLSIFSISCLAASSVDSAVISEVLSGPSQGGKVLLKVSPNPSSLIGCSAEIGTTWNYVFDSSTDDGKNTLSMVLTAYASGKPVKLVGASECGINGSPHDVERLGAIILK